MKILDEIREAIIKLENKNYKVNSINLSDDMQKKLVDNFNKMIGVKAFSKLDGINTLFSYEIYSSFDNTPVSFNVTIKFEDIK